MLLRPEQRAKLDPTDDSDFYSVPRLVTHVDGAFLDRLTQLYRDRLRPKTRLLDLMSSWVSHLPEEMTFAHVEGHGLNAIELAKNPRLDRYFVQDLNANPKLPYSDGEFDAVLNCVSVQYLQYPEAVFSEIARILQPGGLVIVSFSNRMFYQKAIAAWRDATEAERVALVQRYFQSNAAFQPPEAIAVPNNLGNVFQFLGFGGADPFYAVVAQRR